MGRNEFILSVRIKFTYQSFVVVINKKGSNLFYMGKVKQAIICKVHSIQFWGISNYKIVEIR